MQYHKVHWTIYISHNPTFPPPLNGRSLGHTRRHGGSTCPLMFIDMSWRGLRKQLL